MSWLRATAPSIGQRAETCWSTTRMPTQSVIQDQLRLSRSSSYPFLLNFHVARMLSVHPLPPTHSSPLSPPRIRSWTETRHTFFTTTRLTSVNIYLRCATVCVCVCVCVSLSLWYWPDFFAPQCDQSLTVCWLVSLSCIPTPPVPTRLLHLGRRLNLSESYVRAHTHTHTHTRVYKCLYTPLPFRI